MAAILSLPFFYFDTVVDIQEIDILKNKFAWINDNIISFTYEYSCHVTFKDSKFLFIDPPTVFFWGNVLDAPDILSNDLRILDAFDKRIIFFPLNNNADTERIGGTHWSLLVYTEKTQSFTFYDSLTSSGMSKDAIKLAQAIAKALEVPLQFSEEYCPQQHNAIDCGLFLICVTEFLCKKYLGATEDIDTIPHFVKAKRQQILV